MSKVYVFWDHSNIFVGAQHVAAERDGVLHAAKVRIQLKALSHLATWGRPDATKPIIVASETPYVSMGVILNQIHAHVEIYERGATSNTEQAVDAALQVHMLRALVDEPEPCVAVLLSGDGAGYENGIGFRADLERMARKGWGVEVLAWTHSCDEALRKWAEEAGVFIPLEKYYDYLTFVDGGRNAKPFPLTGRPLTKPQACSPAAPSSPTSPPSSAS